MTIFDQHQFSIVNQLKHLFISLSNNGLITVDMDSNCNSYSQYLMILFAQHSLFKLNIEKASSAGLQHAIYSIELFRSSFYILICLVNHSYICLLFICNIYFLEKKSFAFDMIFSHNRQRLHRSVFFKVFRSKKRNEAFFFPHCDFKVVLINS